MDGAARIAEALLTFRFTTSIHVGGSATMPNQIWSRCALTVIKKFIPRGKSRNPQRIFETESDACRYPWAGYWLVPRGETSHK
jgi:hypothetical protein